MNFASKCRSLICFLLILSYLHADQHFVTARLWGRLGNHLFIIAATTSLALDNGAVPAFHDLVRNFGSVENSNFVLSNLKSNYINMFSKLNTTNYDDKVEFVYREPSFAYSYIPYHPNMLLEGWFQSEKYFSAHKNEIIDLFSPSKDIMEYLTDKYRDIIDVNNTVSVHLRCYTKENKKFDIVYPTYGRDYFVKAMKYFDKNVQFIVFSDQIEWAKEQLAGIPRKIRFIEGEEYYNDFYLMSLCKHNIICNSTFSWWAAYLNRNKKKKIIAPSEWFKASYNQCTKDLIPKEWILIK